jgi:hypothetical protein
VRAARLAIELARGFTEAPDAVRALIRHLLNFTMVVLRESSIPDCNLARLVASEALVELRAEIPNANLSNILLAELVVLGLGQKPGDRRRQFDESALRRRFSADPRWSQTPASAEWRRGWRVIKAAARLASTFGMTPESELGDLRAAVRKRLGKRVKK